jgi:hypothetical protein
MSSGSEPRADGDADPEPSPETRADSRPAGSDSRRALAVTALVVTVVVAAIAGAAIPGADRSSLPTGPDADGETSVDATTRLDRLHDAGVTGTNVTVGVVGVTGFDVDHPALSGRVVVTRSFGAAPTVGNGGRTAHGTAAASIVTATAPDARLALATVETAGQFRTAVAWLVARDVDVIVAPIGFYGTPGDGTSPAARAVRLATDEGVPVVASAGNLGRGHWRGEFDPASAGVHRFAGGERNFLTDRIGGGDRLDVWLTWESPTATEPSGSTETPFTVALYRAGGPDGNARLVAKSRTFTGGETPGARVTARLAPDGTYFLRVRGPTAAAGTRLRVAAPTHALQYRARAGSVVAPATAPSALSVGAYDPRTDRVEPFSSAGPVDGRPGVDVVAPDRLRAPTAPGGLVGSSAAAPYVAGVVALLLEVRPDLSPAAVERRLEGTARDVAEPGEDPVGGNGLVRPDLAVPATDESS